MSVTPRPFGTQRVGVDRRAEPQALTDTPSIDNINAPDVAVPGDLVTIQVRVRCQTVPLGACECAVRFSGGGDTIRKPTSGQETIRESNTETFDAQFRMTDGPLTVLVETLEFTDVVGWGTVESQEFVINPVTEDEKQERERRQAIRETVPWAVVGGGLGAGAAFFSDRRLLGPALIGSGVGVGLSLYDREIGFPEFGLEFPTVELLTLAAVFGAGYLLLTRFDLDFSREDLPSLGGRSNTRAERVPSRVE